MTLAEFWPLCLRRLHDKLPPQQFEKWIAPLTVGEENGMWVVYGKNQFAFNMLKNQFAAEIEAVRKELVPSQQAFAFKTGCGQCYEMAPSDGSEPSRNTDKGNTDNAFSDGLEDKNTIRPSEKVSKTNTAGKKSAQDILAERIKQLPPESGTGKKAAETKPVKPAKNEPVCEQDDVRYTQTNLSRDYTFETLVEGKGNRIAAAAAQSIAENPGQSYNPFFLYGSTGLGKTHLVQAIGNELLKNKPDAKVRYMHSDDYIRSFMNAVRTNGYDMFKQQYKQYDLLIIDDIQFIKGKDRTMEEFFYLYNHFHNEKKQLILTCDVLPTKIEDMDDRLKSRFSWGLTLELEPPELEMRVAILQKKAETAGVDLNEDAAFFIANLIRSNVRELEGAFNRVSASSRFLNKPIDIDLARKALQDIVASSYKVITADLIIDATAKYYRIKISDILGKKRTRNIARPRQIAMSLTKELTNLSLPSIGEAFGGRDHTTVMHGVKAVAKLREEDPELAQDYEKLLIIIQN
ncbi:MULTISPECIES: chromosomal replication initiator protein DnaA [unclassified Neisseria]|uniref:chromosomal replication initiator protein DnaA n=1 Tax=unclassified Neisseria TaxID=2623750 RepID=UPI002665AE22|nr:MULTISPECIES: chromosomal replication initiator protein DnaA [unclassified Neisseria]MDO1509838.1 chromosomal replication initiator protein DnaA [Neisseria sp. MVDL19-042950]MDO1515838.1 chromosomal replication initiator protein DnaA [Neisseria sp. MVDL18-041461]MDO1562951.1 chromosomal replication initiator protein DnaA [Neisseria sp. MVDL20-010259]